MSDLLNRCHFGDVREVLRRLIDAGVRANCIVTSPPYWGLRSYLPEGHPDKAREIGSEPTIQEFIATMTGVFELCREILTDDGTCWVNMGDCYAANRAYQVPSTKGGPKHSESQAAGGRASSVPTGLKPKDLVGQPWRLAFALQDAGWYLRQDIIWSKPNPMPESMRDRCTKAHEYIFLLSKSERYWWDFDAMQEPVNGGAHSRRPSNGVGFGHGTDRDERGRDRQAWKTPDGWDASKGEGGHGNFHKAGREKGRIIVDGVGHRQGPPGNPPNRIPGNINPPKYQRAYEAGATEHRTKGGLLAYAERQRKLAESGTAFKNNDSMDAALAVMPAVRNRRSVWTMATQPYSEAHFATFPEELPERCILAGCPVGGVVLDPFFGSGTTGSVAQRLGRQWIGIELNPANEPLQAGRLRQLGLALEAA